MNAGTIQWLKARGIFKWTVLNAVADGWVNVKK